MARSWLLVLVLVAITGVVGETSGTEESGTRLDVYGPTPKADGQTTSAPLLGDFDAPLAESTRESMPWRMDALSERYGARLGFDPAGPASGGISWQEVQLFDALPSGEQSLLNGYVLAADLRLKMGDNSVLLEYAQSVVDHQLSGVGDPEAGREMAASVLRRLNDQITLNFGFRRITSSFSPLSDIVPGQVAPDMYGIEAGFSWRTPSLGFRSQGAVYRPEGERVGYANRFDAAVNYNISDAWRVDVGYQSLNRRRLANLEDAWTNIVTGGLQFGGDRAFRANVNYRFDLDQTDSGFAESGHSVGASLELGF